MKKILMIALCLGLVPMLFAAQEDAIQKTGFFSESGARIRIMSETEFEAMVDLQPEDSLYYYTSDPTLNAIGFGSPLTWEGALRFTPTELAPYVGDEITAICWYHYDGSSPNGRVIVYDNNTPVWPGPVLQEDPLLVLVSDGSEVLCQAMSQLPELEICGPQLRYKTQVVDSSQLVLTLVQQ